MLSWQLAFAWIKTFSILSAAKLIVRNLVSVTYLEFVGSLLQLFDKEHWLEKFQLFL